MEKMKVEAMRAKGQRRSDCQQLNVCCVEFSKLWVTDL